MILCQVFKCFFCALVFRRLIWYNTRMKDCEHLLEEIADRQKDIYDILVFFKIVVIVCLCLATVGFLLWVGNFVLWFYMVSQLFK